MKRIVQTSILLLMTICSSAQENIDDLLAAGITDAQKFSASYLAPATEGIAHGINNGWFNNGKALKRLRFEISLVANATFINDEHKAFELHVSDYENIRFPDNAPSKMVATALGHNDTDQTVIITYDDPIFGSQEKELTLPTGIGASNINIIPTAFLQASFAPFKGTVLKARFFPKVNTNDAKVNFYGAGIQQEFTKWLPADKILPIAISGLVAYTHLDASYDFTSSNVVAGTNQQVETDTNTLLAELIVATKLKVINFYAGLGYLRGKTTSKLQGSYIITDGIIFSEEINNPFSVEQDISGIKATLGANLKLGFFGMNVDYSVGDFNSASLGLNFGF